MNRYPHRKFYDNQTFYDNVNFGYKHGRNNIRNMDRDPVGLSRRAVQLLTRLRIVDNSKYAMANKRKGAKVIQVYSPTQKGQVGDVCKVTINGEMHKALIVGQKLGMGVMKARMDTNNAILLDDDLNPVGTRITAPLPSWLRGYKQRTRHQVSMSKVIALTGKFV